MEYMFLAEKKKTLTRTINYISLQLILFPDQDFIYKGVGDILYADISSTYTLTTFTNWFLTYQSKGYQPIWYTP